MRERILQVLAQGPAVYIIQGICAVWIATIAIRYFVEGNPEAGIAWTTVAVYILVLALQVMSHRMLNRTIQIQRRHIENVHSLIDERTNH